VGARRRFEGELKLTGNRAEVRHGCGCDVFVRGREVVEENVVV
jgi:hypothetical protein